MDTSTDPDHLVYKWGDANNPAAFGGISSVKHNSPTLSLAQIKDQLLKSQLIKNIVLQNAQDR